MKVAKQAEGLDVACKELSLEGGTASDSKVDIDRDQQKQVLVTYGQLNALGITYSREHLRRLEADDRFPLRVRLSPARVAWLLKEVTDWISLRANERRPLLNSSERN